jgi:probable phosphoglycerate mutase
MAHHDPAHAMSAPTRLVLVRHGEARAGVDRVIGGPQGCRGLTEHGRHQAALLRERFLRTGGPAPSAVYTSVLPRAIETATILARAFPEAGPPVRDCDYCEMHPGDCDGMSYEDARARYAPDTVADDPDAPMSPGGESTREFDARVRRATAALIDRHNSDAFMIVTHGGFIAAAVLFLLGAPGLHERDQRPFRLQAANTSVTEFSRAPRTGVWTLERYNDVAHLERR